MNLVALIILAAAAYHFLPRLVRSLGFSLDPRSLVGWGIALVGVALVAGALSGLAMDADATEIPAGSIIVMVAFISLGLLGVWSRQRAVSRAEAMTERNARARTLPRRLALPPAPQFLPPDGREK